jgi:hypothetical protein
MKRSSPVLLVTLIALLPPSATHARSAADVPRVDNPAKAPSARTAHLEELWRIGGDTDAEGEIFGKIADLAVGGDGSVYVLDWQAQDVRVFTRDGAHVRTVGREGDGPGELRSPAGLIVMSDGRIGVCQPSPPRVSVFETDGTYASEFYFTPDPEHGFQYLGSIQCREGTFLVSGVDVRQGADAMEQIVRLMQFDAAGKFLCELAKTVHRFDYGNLVVRDDATAFGVLAKAGRAYVVDGWDYEIAAYGPGCQGDRLIARAYEHRKRTGREIEAITDYYRRGGGSQGARFEISKVERDVAWMSARDDGRLWVLSSRGRVDLPEDSLGVFDVYDPAGKLAESVDLRGEGSPQTDRYYLVGDRLFVVTRANAPRDGTVAEAEPTGVICYRAPE